MIICFLQWRQPYEITDCVSSGTHLPTFRRRYMDAWLLIRPVRYLYLKTGHSVRKTSHYHMRVSGSDGRAFQAEVKLQQQDGTVPRLSEIIREKKKFRLQRLYALHIWWWWWWWWWYGHTWQDLLCLPECASQLWDQETCPVYRISGQTLNSEPPENVRRGEPQTITVRILCASKASSKLLQSQYRLQYLLPLTEFGSRVLEYAGI